MYSEAFAKELWHGRPLPEYDHLKLPKNTPRQNVKSGGYVKESYQYAWWCVQNTDSFEEAVMTAFNRGHDADTSGAITGQLAARIYGIDGDKAIPDWIDDGLYAHQHLVELIFLESAYTILFGSQISRREEVSSHIQPASCFCNSLAS